MEIPGIKQTGIKCDNETCDYSDDSVKSVDYTQWIDKACPKCGDNLLTQEAFDNSNSVMAKFSALVEALSEIIPEQEGDEKVDVKIAFDKDGNLDLSSMLLTPTKKDTDSEDVTKKD
jgi:hypothetical protein